MVKMSMAGLSDTLKQRIILTNATMRSTAEQVSADELNKLVFVPYANPFRLYELHKD